MRRMEISGRRTSSLARRLGLDRNPLRRGTDRAEAWIRISLVLAFLIGAPLAAWGAGSWAESVAPTAAHLQLAGEHRVPATLLRSVPGDSDQWFTVRFAWVKARWTVPHGPVRTGYVQAPVGSRSGSTVPVWLDRAWLDRAAAAAQPDPGLGAHDGRPRARRAGAAVAGHAGNPRPHHEPAAAGQLGTGVVGDRATVDPAPPLTSKPHR